MTKAESESKTKAAIAGVADPATLVLLRGMQELLREVDEIKSKLGDMSFRFDVEMRDMSIVDRVMSLIWQQFGQKGRRR
jgi:hypothetical protein